MTVLKEHNISLKRCFRALQMSALLIVAALVSDLCLAQVINNNPSELNKVNVVEHLGEKIPLDLQFTDAQGKTLKLAELFGQGKPILMTLVYYKCPMLCTFALTGVSEAVAQLPWQAGKEFQMVSVSINPEETAELAQAKQANYLEAIGLSAEQTGAWRFLTAAQNQAKVLADALGFQYYYDEKIDEYAHPAVAFILTEDGTISRYLYGLQHEVKDMRLALLEGSQGKIGTTLDRILLYCFRYDAEAKGYVLFARNVMKLGGLFSVLLLALFLGALWRRDRSRSKSKNNVAEEDNFSVKTGTGF